MRGLPDMHRALPCSRSSIIDIRSRERPIFHCLSDHAMRSAFVITPESCDKIKHILHEQIILEGRGVIRVVWKNVNITRRIYPYVQGGASLDCRAAHHGESRGAVTASRSHTAECCVDHLSQSISSLLTESLTPMASMLEQNTIYHYQRSYNLCCKY